MPLFAKLAFSQRSAFNRVATMTERGGSYEEKCLTEEEISAELLADELSDHTRFGGFHMGKNR